MIDRAEQWWRRLRAPADRHRWVARRTGQTEEPAPPQGPGLLLIQIDGLGIDVLRRAETMGLMPKLRALRASEPYRLSPIYAGVPSSTPAFQAELFYGEAGAVPAYSFVHRATRRVFRMSDREAASSVEAGLPGRGLLDGGSSYGNIYRGGATVTRFSMATLGWGDLFQASRPRDLPVVVLGHGFDLVRVLLSSTRELALGVPQMVAAVRSGEHLGTELHFLQARIGVTVVLREALTTLASIDVARGLPIVHLDLLGYDEWAHRRGPRSPEALRALRDIDRAIGRLSRAARRRDRRDYDVWVFSDHGQERTESYIETHGRPVAEAVGAVLEAHGIGHDDAPEPREGVQGQRAAMLGYRMAELLVPGLELTPRSWETDQATTTALGPLGHVYLPEPVDEQRRAAIATDLVHQADIPLILAADGPGRAIAWSDRGHHDLPNAAAAILGENHPYLTEAAEDLVNVCHHPDAGDLVISGWRRDGPPVSFPHENGSHAGPGPSETSAFVWAPADTPLDWEAPRALRARDLHNAAFQVLEGTGHRPAARWQREPDRTTLRLVTYNVHSCVGLDGVTSPERIARVIARIEPDIVALQELDVGRARTGGTDQAQIIAAQLGMIAHFHPTFRVAGEQFGDAVLSRLPMRLCKAGSLPRMAGDHGLEPRGAVWVEIDAGDATFQVINTHLSIHPRERRMQADALLGSGWLGEIDPGSNVVLCGDFNASPGLPTCRAISRRLTDVQIGLDGHRPRRTWGGRWPVARIDHIYVDPSLEVLHVDVPATHLTRTASDHLPLHADIRARPPAADGHASTTVA
ncbi:MAG: endonuclease/exonuclease/phosphatase family protein [Acidimicrobiia bacterium]|nr:endonuclease/exonuclease/phosphatase family protein [Acidimicrobiia bacterium]MDH5236859.1 endonuclease/exonuclease/phosphatase family protein [Acidimicrobiia bacterium]